MQALGFWCAGSLLFFTGTVALFIALLHHGRDKMPKNRRLTELIWQSRSQNTEWWLDINKKDK